MPASRVGGVVDDEHRGQGDHGTHPLGQRRVVFQDEVHHVLAAEQTQPAAQSAITDSQIARIFQRSIGIDATLGGIAGLSVGSSVVLVLGRQFAALGSGMIAGGMLGWQDWLVIAAIPVAGILIAMLTARITVLIALRRML